MPTTDDYLVSEICKAQSEVLKTLDDIKEELEKMDAQAISEVEYRVRNEEDLLVKLHEYMKSMQTNMAAYHIGALIFAILGKPKGE